MKRYISKYKGFFVAIIIEVLIVLIIGISSIGKVTEIELNADNIEIYDDKAVIDNYEPVDSLTLDENTLVVYDNKATQNIDKSIYISGRNDEETFSRYILGSTPLELPAGMYEIEVKYYSLLYNNETAAKNDDYTAIVQVISEDNASNIFCNDMFLYDSVTVNSQRLWIRSIKSIDDVQVKVIFNGIGDFRLDSIVIKELPLWRLLKLLAWILLFGAVDILYMILFTDNNFKSKGIFALLVATVMFSCLPLFTNFLLIGHDIDFHVARIWALAENIQAGNWSFPIQTEMANGYGYASPIFYGQIFFYIPAIVYLMGAPIQVCFQLYVALINVATVVISYFSFKGIVKDKKIAVIGSALYTLSAYRIVDVYLRSAAGEYTALMFYPLIMYGFASIYMKQASKINWKDCLTIIIGLTGLIESHVLSCELAAVFIIIFCLISFRKTFEPKRFVVLAVTAVTTLLLNIAYIVPFITSMGMHIRVYEQETEKIQYHGAYLIQILGVFMTSVGDSVGGMAGDMPMALGFALVLGVGSFIWCCMNKYKWEIVGDKLLKAGTICTGFTVVCVVLSLRIFPWDSIEQISPSLAKALCVIQFPWRYLSVATIFAVTATLLGLKIASKYIQNQTLKMIELVLVAFTLVQAGLFYTNFADSATEYKVYGGADVEQDTVGGEYMITGTIEGYQRWRSIKADLSNVGIAGYESDHGKVTFVCNNISDEEKFVQIPIMNYDNYHAFTDDGTELRIENGENNRLGLWVPSGYNGIIRVQYIVPLSWKLANVVTAIVFVAIVITCYVMSHGGRKKIKEN
jgi:hypothetical protein